MTSEQITRLMHTRGIMVATGIIGLAVAVLAYAYTDVAKAFTTYSLVDAWCGSYTLPRLQAFVAETALNIAVLALMVNINKMFNLLRTHSGLQGTFFILLQLISPTFVLCLSPGTAMCVVALLCVWLLFAIYGDESIDTRKVFLVFAILSGCSIFDVHYIVLMPVFIIGCMQMQVFSLRSLSAIVLGMVTPWVILLGFGIVRPESIAWPQMQYFLGRLTPGTTMVVVTAATTGFVTLAALLQNVIKIMTYNAHSRAMLGVITTLTCTMLILPAVNSAAISYYLPLLNCCCAMQLSHLFGVIHTARKSYIAVLSVAGLFLVILLWKAIEFLM